MTRLTLLFIMLGLAMPVAAQDWTVTSPDGRTTMTVARTGEGRLTWRAARAGAAIVADSPLGVRRRDQAFVDRLTVTGASEPIAIDERYRTPHGKRHDHHVQGRERAIAVTNAAGARLELVVRAHNDGVAFRYRFPDEDATQRTVVEELTGFAVPPGSTGWLQPMQPVHRYGPAYEEFYEEVKAGTRAPRKDGWAFPALFRTPDSKWLLIAESGFDGTYCGTHLNADARDSVYRIAFPQRGEGKGVGQVDPASTLPWALPWRVVIIADAAVGLLESDLVNDLSSPTKIADTSWIKTGRAAWSWWSESDSPKQAERLNAFTDLAADMTWEYSLVDANWNFMQSGRIEDVVAHAREKGVGLLFWYNSGGPHNDVTEAPRDRMHRREVRRAEFAKLREWGVKGIKVDFWHSDKQDRIQQYRDILQDAAEYQLLVNFHGSTIPRGWEREFPHLVGMEAVFGAEQYKFRPEFSKRAASHNTVLPFTRNVIGLMDYTPVTFTDHKHPRTTTNAHELAQSIVFQTAIQHFADGVDAYRALPEAPKAFLRDVPVVWDETRAILGEPGRAVAIARRHDRVWYIGALNGDAVQHTTVFLNFLAPGSWQMELIKDGAEDRAFDTSTRDVTSADSVDVPMRARGGFVMKLVPR